MWADKDSVGGTRAVIRAVIRIGSRELLGS